MRMMIEPVSDPLEGTRIRGGFRTDPNFQKAVSALAIYFELEAASLENKIARRTRDRIGIHIVLSKVPLDVKCMTPGHQEIQMALLQEKHHSFACINMFATD